MAATDEILDNTTIVKETIPLWLAVAITVAAVMPFALWLGEYNFALWCSFVVWTQYFTLGAKPGCLKIIIPAFSFGVILTALTLIAVPLFSFLPSLKTEGDLAMTATLFVGVGFMVYLMNKSSLLQAGSLPYFNGISMVLAIYFTGSFPALGEVMSPALTAAAWTLLMGLFGCLMGVFNVWITFPKSQS